ncbi:MAG: hypothetical protein L0215_24290 [Gemmataceae bacterium]|nr:hypothetical protein [Gemmataceae bacterium]
MRPTLECLEDRVTPVAGVREQYMLELVNRMRTNPAAELPLLWFSDDPFIQQALTNFGVSKPDLDQQWASLTPVAPLAWNDDLAEAALAYCNQMVSQQQELPAGVGLPDRALAAGYTSPTALGENVYAFAQSMLEAHARFAIDWAINPPTGIRNPPVSRQNLMSAIFREFGIGIKDDNTANPVGPIVITQDFGNRNFGNAFLVGSVFLDIDINGYYDIGEGLAGVTITATPTSGRQPLSTVSTAAGGYQIQLAPGTYNLTASGGALSAPVSVSGVVVGTNNVHQNFARQALDQPVIFEPLTPTSDNTPTIKWDAIVGATKYDLWVDNLSTGTSQFIRQQNLTATSFTRALALPLGSYRAWVRALDDDGDTSAWSPPYTFTLTPPSIPTLTGPLSFTTDRTPEFAWTGEPNAARFDLWVDSLSTGQSQVIRQQNLTTTTFSPATNLAYGNYRFWVRAFNSTNDSAGWSVAKNFSLVPALPPTVTAPGNTTDPTPTFEWTAGPEAVRFDLWVNNLTTGQSQVIRQTNLTASPFTPVAPLTVSSSYRVWVQAFNSANEAGPWSQPHDFFLDTTAPAIPTLTGPATPTANLKPTITWTDVGAHHYDLWVDYTTTGQSQIIRQQNLTTNSFTPIGNLQLGSYQAWVRSFDVNGLTRGWSVMRTFTIVVPGTPTLIGPSGTTVDTTPTFDWSAIADAAKYDLWVNNRTTGQSQVIREQNLATDSFTPSTALALGSYRFWVRAINAAGNAGAWSGFMDFTIV